jgi:hypothetical protein
MNWWLWWSLSCRLRVALRPDLLSTSLGEGRRTERRGKTGCQVSVRDGAPLSDGTYETHGTNVF